MGKVRIKSFDEGSEEIRKPKKNKKTAITEAQKTELSVSDNLTDSVVARETLEDNKKTAPTETQKNKKTQKKKSASSGKAKKVRSKSYITAMAAIDKNKTYSLSEALELLSKIKRAKFDETVELHIITGRESVSTQVVLPHGTGKKTRVAIADDAILVDIEKGKIEFDVLLATPDFMPKLARVAKFLGPRGLMPNPKSGTVTSSPKSVAKKYEEGQTNIKTEAKFPLIHITVGKVSFGKEKLGDNIKAVLSAVKSQEVKKAVLKSTMSPAIKIEV